MILDAVRESNGRAIAVDESKLRYWMAWVPRPRESASALRRLPVSARSSNYRPRAGSIGTNAWVSVQYRRAKISRGHGRTSARDRKDAPLDWNELPKAERRDTMGALAAGSPSGLTAALNRGG